MRTTTRFFGSFACCLFCIPAVFAQTNPPPPDPHEMVTHQPRILAKPAERSAAFEILERARKNADLNSISTPYALKVSFETNGAAQTEGEGIMEELSDGAAHWRWTAQLGDTRVIRIGADGHVYGTSASEAVPLRVQLVRSALHLPISRFAGGAAMRALEGVPGGGAVVPGTRVGEGVSKATLRSCADGERLRVVAIRVWGVPPSPAFTFR